MVSQNLLMISLSKKTEKKSSKNTKNRVYEELKPDRRHHEDDVQAGFAGQVRLGTCQNNKRVIFWSEKAFTV